MSVFLPAAPASSRIYDDPLEFNLVDVRSNDGVVTWTLNVVAGRAGNLQEFRVEGARFAAPAATNAVTPLSPEKPLPVVVQRSSAGTSTTCTFRYQFDGKGYVSSLTLPDHAVSNEPGRLVPSLNAPPSTDRRKSITDPELGPTFGFGDYHGSYGDIQQELPLPQSWKTKAARDITVHGRIVFEREDTVMTAGAAKATVIVYDKDWVGNTFCGATVTDWEGYYSVTFTWDPWIEVEKNPDLYVYVEAANSRVEVKKLLGGEYSWSSSVSNKFTGTDLDEGTLQPGDSAEHPALFILTNVTRGYRWSSDRGYVVPSVEVKWPSDGLLGTYYNPVFETVHLGSDADSQANEDTQVHEYGHHWEKSFADFVIPTYLDPHAGRDGHSDWCSENDVAAWEEGWGYWFSAAVLRSFYPTYGVGAHKHDIYEKIKRCGEDNSFSPTETEGTVAALLRDIEDGVDVASYNELDSLLLDSPDRLAMGTDEILAVYSLDEPTTVGEFLTAFRSRYPTSGCDLCSTARNNGFHVAPGAVTGLTASSAPGPAHCALFTNALEFNWAPPPGTGSCMTAYSISITSSPQMPDAVAELGAVTSYVTPCLGSGQYAFNVRARDVDGNWSTEFASYPFQFSGPPVVAREQGTPAPQVFTVRQNYPNPFSVSTDLEIGLVSASDVTVDVFDVLGRRVTSMAQGKLEAGWRRIAISGQDGRGNRLPNGVYFYRVRANGEEITRKMVIAR
jgi:hypothetical protein